MKAVVMGLLAAVLAGAAVPTAAQARYACRNASGGVYMSNFPCPGATAGSGNAQSQPGLVYYGPDTSASRYRPTPPRAAEAPAHLRHMSPHCASLHDAIRTANVRGLRSDTVATMQRNYRAECGDNEREALAELSRERGEVAQERRSQQEADRRDKERASLHAQQCGESKRILISKRARTDLTEGEKAELRRFEDNYKSRCS